MTAYNLESKTAALLEAVFVDFSKNICNFLHQNVVGSNSSHDGEEFFSRDSCHQDGSHRL